jgi:tRNA 2-thiouridine synthesizing protein B
MLHILASAALNPIMVERIAVGSAVLLQQNSVWALRPGHQDFVCLEALLAKSCQVYVLLDDLKLSGLSELSLPASVQAIDYAGWVALTVEHEVIKTWH